MSTCTQCKINDTVSLNNNSAFINSDKIIYIKSSELNCTIAICGNKADRNIQQKKDLETRYFTIPEIKLVLENKLTIKDVDIISKLCTIFSGTIENIKTGDLF